MNQHDRSPNGDYRIERLRALVDDCRQRRSRGEELADEEIISAHADLLPELADELRALRPMPPMLEQESEPPLALHDVDVLDTDPSNAGAEFTVDFDPSPADAWSQDPAPPSQSTVRTFGDYEILGRIAEGGMGVVYKARHTKLHRLVALKTIRSGTLANEVERQRFYAEAESAGKLDHPNIVPIYEVGEHGGQHYFAMAFVDGPSLSRRIREKPLPPEEAAAYVRATAEAIQFAHEHGILHRDIKPSNVLIDQATNQVRVTDFGLAKRIDSDADLTASGQVLGTPSYMPPEQALGDHSQIDRRSDVYSLGALLYALLTGRPPFQTDATVGTLLQVIEKEPVHPRQLVPTVPVDLESICLKCLEKQPARRYQSAGELAADVARFQRGEPTLARPLSRQERAARWCRKNPIIAGLTAAVALLLVVGTIVSTSFAFSSYREAVRAKTAEDIANARTLEVESEKNRAVAAEESMRRAKENALTEAERARVAEQRSVSESERAKAEAERATAAEKESQLNLYFSNIALADQLLNDGQPEQARAMLDACPVQFRHWEWQYLSGRTTRGRHNIQLPSNGRCAAYSEDGRYIAFGTEKGELVLWDSATEANVFSKKVHEMEISDVAFHPDGSQLATAGADGVLNVWSMPSLELVRTHDDFSGPLTRGLAYSPNGAWLASTEEAKQIHIHSAKDGQRQQTITPESAGLRGLGWMADSERLYLAHATPGHGHIALYSVAAVPATRLSQTHDLGNLDALAISRDGKVQAECGNTWLRVWNIAEPKVTQLLFRGDSHYRCIAISGDGRVIVANGVGSGTSVFDVNTGRRLYHLAAGDRVAIHPLGASFVSFYGYSNLAQVYPTRPLREAYSVAPGSLSGFSADGSWVATQSGVYESATGTKMLAVGGKLLRSNASLARLVFNRGSLQTFDPVSGREQGNFTVAASRNYFGASGWSADLRFLAVAESTNAIRLWDIESSTELPTIPGVGSIVMGIAFSPNEAVIAVGYGEGKVRLWDRKTAELLGTFGNHAPEGNVATGITSLAYNSNGQILATGGGRSDRTIQLWDTSTRNRLRILTGSSGGINSLSFSSDGQRLASSGDDGMLRLWHTETGRQLIGIEAASSRLYYVAFSPDNQQIAASDYSRMWVFGQAARRLPIIPGQPIDLLPWLRRSAAAGPGDQFGGGEVSLRSSSKVSVPVALMPTGSYSLRGAFTRTRSARTKTVGFLLPAKAGKTMLCFDHEDRGISGLDQVDKVGVGNPADKSNPTNRPGRLKDGQRYTIEVRVDLKDANATVTVTLDGQPYIEWTGPQTSLAMWPAWEVSDPRMLGVALAEVDVTIEQLELIPHDGEVHALDSTPLPPRGVQVVTYPATIDLLPLIDPKLDVFDGKVEVTKEGLTLTKVSGKVTRLPIPVRPLGTYELSLNISRGDAKEWIAIGLPTTHTRGACFFDVKRISFIASGIERIRGDGVGERNNPATVKGARLPAGQTHDVLVRVLPKGKRVSVEVVLNGASLAKWEGEQANWSLWPEMEVPNPQVPFIGCGEGSILIHRASLKLLDGDAWLLRPKTEAGAPDAAIPAHQPSKPSPSVPSVSP